jgi:hypothetical protein
MVVQDRKEEVAARPARAVKRLKPLIGITQEPQELMSQLPVWKLR